MKNFKITILKTIYKKMHKTFIEKNKEELYCECMQIFENVENGIITEDEAMKQLKIIEEKI